MADFDGTRANSFTDSGNIGMTSNPIFSLKVRGLETNYEQKPPEVRPESNDEITDKFKIGDIVTGKENNSNKTYTGKILTIEKNEDSDGSTVTIISRKTKEKIKLDATTCTKEVTNNDGNDEKNNGEPSTPPFYAENFIQSFDDWKKLNS